MYDFYRFINESGLNLLADSSRNSFEKQILDLRYSNILRLKKFLTAFPAPEK